MGTQPGWWDGGERRSRTRLEAGGPLLSPTGLLGSPAGGFQVKLLAWWSLQRALSTRLGKGTQEEARPLPRTFSCMVVPREWGDWISILRYIINSTNWFRGAKGPATGFIDLLGKITVHAFSPESNCFASQSGQPVPSHHHRPAGASDSWPNACLPLAASGSSALSYGVKPLCRALQRLASSGTVWESLSTYCSDYLDRPSSLNVKCSLNTGKCPSVLRVRIVPVVITSRARPSSAARTQLSTRAVQPVTFPAASGQGAASGQEQPASSQGQPASRPLVQKECKGDSV